MAPCRPSQGPRKPGLWEESGILVGPRGDAERPRRKLSSGPYCGGDPGRGVVSGFQGEVDPLLPRGPGSRRGSAGWRQGLPAAPGSPRSGVLPSPPKVGDGEYCSQISGNGHSLPGKGFGTTGPRGAQAVAAAMTGPLCPVQGLRGSRGDPRPQWLLCLERKGEGAAAQGQSWGPPNSRAASSTETPQFREAMSSADPETPGGPRRRHGRGSRLRLLAPQCGSRSELGCSEAGFDVTDLGE